MGDGPNKREGRGKKLNRAMQSSLRQPKEMESKKRSRKKFGDSLEIHRAGRHQHFVLRSGWGSLYYYFLPTQTLWKKFM
jgi:hypothetical protein